MKMFFGASSKARETEGGYYNLLQSLKINTLQLTFSKDGESKRSSSLQFI